MEEMEEEVKESPLGSLVEGSSEMLQKSYDYRYELLIISLVSITLCLIGAIMMRKLKKSGFVIYVLGQIIPLIGTALLLGVTLAGGISMGFTAFFALVFIILYATQLKHMK